MGLPFTPDQFFGVFGAYNQALWPFALALWLYALAGALVVARGRDGGRFIAWLLSVQWAWAALAYHAAFFSRINPAAWLFAALFLIQSGLFAWFGLVRDRLRFPPSVGSAVAPRGRLRHAVAWTLIVYSLMYPIVARIEGHVFPESPTFGVPCPTTLLTIGLLFAADPLWPRILAVIPILWAVVGGSAAGLLGVRADLMLGVAALALMGYVLVPRGAIQVKDVLPTRSRC